MLVRVPNFRESEVDCSSPHSEKHRGWASLSTLVPASPGSRGEAKFSRARVADAKQGLELFAGRKSTGGSGREEEAERVGGWERRKRHA